MRIIAVDPGITTGIAMRSGDDISTIVTKEPLAVWHMIRSPLYAWEVCIVEDFHTHGGLISKDGEQTLRIIGGCIDACDAAGVRLVREWPNERRWKLVAAKALLTADPNHPHITPHQIDALAHLLNWEARNS